MVLWCKQAWSNKRISLIHDLWFVYEAKLYEEQPIHGAQIQKSANPNGIKICIILHQTIYWPHDWYKVSLHHMEASSASLAIMRGIHRPVMRKFIWCQEYLGQFIFPRHKLWGLNGDALHNNEVSAQFINLNQCLSQMKTVADPFD